MSTDYGLGADWSLLPERQIILCRTCMRPITWETRTEPGFLPRTGWYDDARSDPLVCFKAVDYGHVPLTDREWAYYEAGRASVEQKLAAARTLADRLNDNPHFSWPGAFKRLHAALQGATP